MKGFITINTDASYNWDHKIGGYAFYIVCDIFKITKSGVIKGHPCNPMEAEIMCILNAFHMVLHQPNYPAVVHTITINSDCKFGLDLLERNKCRFGQLFHFYKAQAMERFGAGLKVRLKHVKAHNGTPDARSWVNDWCDKEAKKEMRKAVAEFKIKNKK